MGRSRRRGPSDPQAILKRRAAQRGQERARERAEARDPATWGVNSAALALPANDEDEVVVRRDPQRPSRVLHARRSDAFSLIYAAARRTVTDDAMRKRVEAQYEASKRYFQDWAARAGVNTDEERIREFVDGGRGSAEGVTHRMIMAGCRIEEAHREVGRAAAALLTALVEPLVMHGEIRVWRAVVLAITGETDRHAQGAVVRQACEALRLAYQEIDRRPPPAGYAARAAEGI